jgi:23S rRNA (uracil1939-C5)-methyltransferase
MEFSSNSRWLTEAEIASTEDLGNRNALGFHIPKCGIKYLISTNVIYRRSIKRNQKRSKDFANANGLTFFNPRAHEGLLRTAAYIFYRRNHGVDSVF